MEVTFNKVTTLFFPDPWWIHEQNHDMRLENKCLLFWKKESVRKVGYADMQT